MYRSVLSMAFTATAMLGAGTIAAPAAWEPVRPVEFIVPAGTGGTTPSPPIFFFKSSGAVPQPRTAPKLLFPEAVLT
jgi:hypothetical protein